MPFCAVRPLLLLFHLLQYAPLPSVPRFPLGNLTAVLFRSRRCFVVEVAPCIFHALKKIPSHFPRFEELFNVRKVRTFSRFPRASCRTATKKGHTVRAVFALSSMPLFRLSLVTMGKGFEWVMYILARVPLQNPIIALCAPSVLSLCSRMPLCAPLCPSDGF